MKTLVTFLFVFSFLFLSGQTQLNLKVEEVTLENGMKVFLNEDPSFGRVLGAVVVNAGSKHDPPDATGIAHYLEHLLFKGTNDLGTIDYEKEKVFLDSIEVLYEKFSEANTESNRQKFLEEINTLAVKAAAFGLPSEMNKVLEEIGSEGINAYTTKDNTVYYNSFPPQQIEKWLHLYSHRFEHPVFRNFQSELEVVYEEKNQDLDQEETPYWDEIFYQLFKDNSYGRQTTLGTVEHLKKPSLKKMKAFFDQYYVANNMALVLCGNFRSQQILPIIQQTFGKLKSGTPPTSSIQKTEFDGRVYVKTNVYRYPYKTLGFKVLPSDLKEAAALEIGLNIMNSDYAEGLFRTLKESKVVNYIRFFPMIYKEDGAVVFSYSQASGGKKVERRVLQVLDKMKDGKFEDELLDLVKTQFELYTKQGFENLESRLNVFIEIFLREQNWEEYLGYYEHLEKITKEDVQSVFQKFFQEDYVMIDFVPPDVPTEKIKLEKPDYQPVQTRQDATSAFAKKIGEMRDLPVASKFLDFQNDIQVGYFKGENLLFCTSNPVNDIFSINIYYNIGNAEDRELALGADLFYYCGTTSKSKAELQKELTKYGGNMSVHSSFNRITVSISGLEKNLEPILKLVNEALRNPKPEKVSMKELVKRIRSNRFNEANNPDGQSSILYHSGVFGQYSSYMLRIPVFRIEEKKPEQLLENFQKVFNYSCSIHFTGKTPMAELHQILEKNFEITNTEKKNQVYVKANSVVEENEILYLQNEDAVQTYIYFYVPGDFCLTDDYPLIDAFNAYFSKLVFQEIREYRSYAYNAFGMYQKPPLAGLEGKTILYASCQKDKTLETLEVMDGIIREMPSYPERLQEVKKFLWNESFTNYPHFRQLSETIEAYAAMGYKGDPNQLALAKYAKLKFEDILTFYEKQIKHKNYRIMITGDLDKITFDALKKYGKLKLVSVEMIRVY